MDRARQPRLAIALISAAVLAYEVLLMGLFSYIQWHHFAYLVVSVALLGFGTSGSLLVFLRQRLTNRFRGFALTQACGFAASALICFAVAQRLAFNPEELVWDQAQWLRLGLVVLLLMLPFVFAANLIGLALIEYRERLARIYAADLVGAGIGAVAIIGLLYIASPSQALGLVALLGLAAGITAWIECGGKAAPAILGFSLIVLGWNLLPSTWIEPLVSPYKELSQVLRIQGTRVVAERSSPLGVITVVESPTVPLRHAPGLSLMATREPPAQLGLFSNADGMSAITRFRGRLDELTYLGDLTSALPYHLRRPRQVLVLGAGGGSPVLQAIYHGAAHIDAIEINPQVIDLVGNRFGEFSGYLYARPQVEVHLAEAREYLQRSGTLYDLIQVPPLDSFGAAATGVHGLNENFIYTVEALQLAFSRLEDEGVLVLTRWLKLPPRDGLKLFAGAVEALELSGIEHPANHLLMIRGLQTSTLIISKNVVSDLDITRLQEFTAARAFDPVYYPGMSAAAANRYNRLETAYFYQGAQALLGEQRERFMRAYKFNLEPARDDRPFHFHFARWSTLAELLELRHRGGSGLIETGYLTLVVTLAISLLLSLLLILLPLALAPRDPTPAAASYSRLRVLFYFAALGLGFLLIEIAFLQKFILLLHHPLYAAAVVLASFLVAAGCGSAYAQKYAGTVGASRRVLLALSGIALLGMLYLLSLGPVLQLAGSWPLAARILLSIGAIFPLGFCMGMPFPLGLSALRLGSSALVPWAWGINGCASVVSATLASLLAIHLGFNLVIGVALACYLVAALNFPRPVGD